MHLLPKDRYDLAIPMISQFELQTVIRTILSGEAPGHIYIDDPEKPGVWFAQFKHRCFIMGGFSTIGNDALNDFFENEVIKNCRQWDVPLFRLSAGSRSWIDKLELVLAPLNPIKVTYRCYQYQISAPLPEISLPDGFTIEPISAALLDKNFDEKEDLLDEMCSERESVDAFLKKSFGTVAFHEQTLAGWCLSEYNHKNQCEVGIATMPSYQKQGLAKSMTYAFFKIAEEVGIEKIVWHCFKSNIASWRTAMSTGFDLHEEEPVLMVYLDQALNSAIHGNLHFEKKDYTEALIWYQKALSAQNPQAWMAWNATCAAAHNGRINLAFDCLHRAIDLGFTDLDYLVQSKHMDLLKEDDRWGEIITRMNHKIHST